MVLTLTILVFSLTAVSAAPLSEKKSPPQAQEPKTAASSQDTKQITLDRVNKPTLSAELHKQQPAPKSQKQTSPSDTPKESTTPQVVKKPISSNEIKPPTTPSQLYREAQQDWKSKKSCQKLKILSADNAFELHELAKIRFAQFCKTKVDWPALQSDLKNEILKKFFVQAWFEYEMDKSNYLQAYRLFAKNRDAIPLEKYEFEDLATKALRTKLLPEERKQLNEELFKRAPRFIPKPKKEDFLKVARDYRSDRQFNKALEYYRRIINDPKNSFHQRWHAYRGARITYKLERWTRMDKYLRASKQWANFLRSKYKWSKELTRLHHDANIEYIRSLWTERGHDPAAVELERLLKELTGRYSLQVVYWLKGRMAEEKKKYDEAVHWLSLSAKEPSLSDSDRERVLWALSWNQRRIQKYQESQATLELLKSGPEFTFFSKSRFLYWQAENLDSMGKKLEAKKAFQDLAELDLFGYYGALAYRKLGLGFPKVPKASFDDKTLLEFFSPEIRPYFDALVEVGEFEIAEEFTLRNVVVDPKWPTQQWVNYFGLLHKAGAYKTFFYRYHTMPPKQQQIILENHPYLLFPQPYREQVLKSSKHSQISASLIYSIMKQESSFDVKARSHADAFGLLQLIPQVADIAAKRMPSVSYTRPYDLYKPDVIIPLGADNLHQLFSQFDSNFILSVASYNASEKAVKGWVKTRFDGDPVSFIEDIPYEETQTYVKLVMRNYIAYNRFDTDTDHFIFPEVCLQGVQNFKN